MKQQEIEDELAEAICRFHLLVPRTKDGVLWLSEASGIFSVKSAYRFLLQDSISSSLFIEGDWVALWKIKIQDRFKLLLWRAMDAFPFKGKICALLNSLDSEASICPLCGVEVETGLHIFFRCFVARVLWGEAVWPLDAYHLQGDNIQSIIRMLSQPRRFLHIDKEMQCDFSLSAAIVVDTIWFGRNRVVHQGMDVNIRDFIIMVHRRFLEHSQTWRISAMFGCKVWCPPSCGQLKCNVDVALRGGVAVLAACFRDSGDSLCRLYTEQFPSINSLLGESSSLVAAINIASNMDWDKVDFEFDCQLLTRMVLDEDTLCGPLLLD
ncbi:hypothetical protein CJ030_MR2G016673 [Morella rubra]|uniref:Reverse transcriptase zinc-binding domain-containing protein n=1 Tax=Morella rubra TaxID=262757 RepID=A0A6A1WEM1_9ROSI|nr:hypothetical protein CJ030_MR2G016673 [Morella rubra]